MIVTIRSMITLLAVNCIMQMQMEMGLVERRLIQSCSAVNGASSQTGDCDDLDPFAFPGSAENDSATSCMRDADGDSYGEAYPANSSVTSGTDCDDTLPAVNP